MQIEASPVRVLVADDDRVFTSLAAAALVAAGCQTAVAHDGAEALEKARSGAFHLVIVDLDMPRIDGFRLIPMLRSDPRCKRIGVLVVTASRDAGHHVAAMSAGADAVQVKPVDWKALPHHVANVLASRDCRPMPAPLRPTQYYAVSTGA